MYCAKSQKVYPDVVIHIFVMCYVLGILTYGVYKFCNIILDLEYFFQIRVFMTAIM